jgi:WD40 repeat protein
LRRAREIPRAAPATSPRVEPAGKPRSATPAPRRVAPPLPPEPLPAVPVDSTRIAINPAVGAPIDGSPYTPIAPASTPIVASALPSTGNVAAVLEVSGRVTLWDVDLHKEVGFFMSTLPLSSSTNDVTRMTLLPAVDQGAAVTPPLVGIVGNDGLLHVWNGRNGVKLFTSPADVGTPKRDLVTKPRVIEAVWSGMTITTTLSSDGRVANWMVAQPAESALVSRPRPPGGHVWGIDANMHQGLVAVASSRGLYVNSRAPGWIVLDSAPPTYPPMYPRRVLFSADGRLVASAWSSNGEIRVYSTETGARIRTMRHGGGFPSMLAFSRDGKLLAATSIGGTIDVWSVTTDAEPVKFTAPRSPLRSMWFAPNRRSLVTAGPTERYFREWVLPKEW